MAGPGEQQPGEQRGILRVNRNLRIPFDELQWRFTTSSGPGGQHANRSSTRAEVRFDIERSNSLGAAQRDRLRQRFGPTVRAASGDERSQWRNRDKALERLAERLADALRVERSRVATTPTAGARARRLDAKRRQATRKQGRAPLRQEEDG